MSVTINKSDSAEEIQEVLRKMMKNNKKRSISLNKYFGKVSFGTDGLTYQKEVRDEW